MWSRLEAAVDSVLQVSSPKVDPWENLGDGKSLPGEAQLRSQPPWAAVLPSVPESWCVRGAARFQRRLEDDGRQELEGRPPPTLCLLMHAGFARAPAACSMLCCCVTTLMPAVGRWHWRDL